MANILLVDDDCCVRSDLGYELTAMGHSVREAVGGRHGCRLAREEPFDFAVVDAFMPDMDGLETVQILKSLRPDLPIVVMVGEGRIDADFACRAALALGAGHAMRKPVDAQAIAEVLPASSRSRSS